MKIAIFIFFLCTPVLINAEPPKSNKPDVAKEPKDSSAGVPCRDRVSGFFSRDIEIPGKCKKGQIRWTLTKKSLVMKFDSPESRELCFVSNAPKGLEKYSVFIVRDKKLEEIGTPMKGSDSCTIINKGKTSIQIQPSSVYYGVYIRYTMIPKEKTKTH